MEIGQLQMTPVKMIGQLIDNKGSEVQTTDTKSFGEFLVDSLKKTNELQKTADKLDMDLAAGKIDDISQVVVASEKAQIALKLALNIRNKAVDAYKEIARMQV